MGLIRRGSEGADVRRIQESLRSLSYMDEPPDGKFGERTDAAVRRFQSDHSLNVDGIVGPNTRGAIDEALGTARRRAGRAREAAVEDRAGSPKRSGTGGRAPFVVAVPGVVADFGRRLRTKVTSKPTSGEQRGTATLELLAVGTRADDFASKFTAFISRRGSADHHDERFSAGRATFSHLRAGVYEIDVDSKLDTPWSPEPGSSVVSLRDGERRQVDVRF